MQGILNRHLQSGVAPVMRENGNGDKPKPQKSVKRVPVERDGVIVYVEAPDES